MRNYEYGQVYVLELTVSKINCHLDIRQAPKARNCTIQSMQRAAMTALISRKHIQDVGGAIGNSQPNACLLTSCTEAIIEGKALCIQSLICREIAVDLLVELAAEA